MRKWECEQKKDKWNTYYKKTMWFGYQMEVPMTEREKMLAGELYDCGDAELLTQWHKAKDLVRDYNQMNSADADEKERILNELLGGKGKNLWKYMPVNWISDFTHSSSHLILLWKRTIWFILYARRYLK